MYYPADMTQDDIVAFELESEIVSLMWDDPLYGVNCELRAVADDQREQEIYNA